MPFKLTKQEIERRDRLVVELNEKWDKLEDAVRAYNEGVAGLRNALEVGVIADYNETLAEARGFAEDIANQADNDISDKSEKWQESERGEAAVAWKDDWETVELENIEPEWPEELEIEAPDHADDLEALAAELSE